MPIQIQTNFRIHRRTPNTANAYEAPVAFASPTGLPVPAAVCGFPSPLVAHFDVSFNFIHPDYVVTGVGKL